MSVFKEIISEITEQYLEEDNNRPWIVDFSGGKDSTLMTGNKQSNFSIDNTFLIIKVTYLGHLQSSDLRKLIYEVFIKFGTLTNFHNIS